ncbi:MAG: flagellar hook-basal body complex protein FliE [Nitrospirae bacterium]|nr:flagellar hook-basal body complex protein FliE [Nitrospirota bacterium]MBF0518352.1 flagellar hook-basal body complex protein FliE [Nitrospirota bacterium]MBF0534921.1 flagellar hook-basal body complex protein FliE [Nitrospirota bacterium]MBF0617228.1 flagellar hook-basal body complex protein FliE [Nitrospirota bacterium]
MADFSKITGTNFAQELNKQTPAATTNDSSAGGGFDNVLKDALTKVNNIQKEADKAIDDLASGGDINNAVLAMEKADMSFQIMQEVRNKLLSAYEEVMRMQV